MPPDANMFIEKRVHPRITLKIPVKYRVIEDRAEIKTVHERKLNEQTSHTFNVSLGGLYLVSDNVIDVGSILRMDITLPEISGVISVYAEVVWSNVTGAGLHFEAIKEEDLEVLKQYLSQKTHQTRISQMEFPFEYNKTTFGHINKGFSSCWGT